MRGLRVGTATFGLLVASVIAPACGDDDNAPVRPAGDGGATVEAGADVVVFDATPSPADAGVFSIEDVADTPCAVRGGSMREIFAPAATKHRPLALVPVGPRRAMRTDDGVVMLDADGANPSGLIATGSLSVTEIGSTANVLGALGSDGATLGFARFDAAGAASGAVSTISASSTGYAAGGGEGKILVAWAENFQLRGVAFGDQGARIAEPFVFRSNTVETDGATFAIAHAGGDEFGVAFAGQYAGSHRLVFTRVSTTKRLTTSFTLLRGADPLRLIGVARVESKFAMLFERRTAASTEILLSVLDGAGRFVGPTRRLLGVRRAFGVASSGGEIGVVVWRAGPGSEPDEPVPDAIEFRPFDGAGAPLGGWVCLDEPFVAPTIDVGAAILGEDTGYSVLMRTPKQAVSMVRVDRRGAGQ